MRGLVMSSFSDGPRTRASSVLIFFFVLLWGLGWVGMAQGQDRWQDRFVAEGHDLQQGTVGLFSYRLVDRTEFGGETRSTYQVFFRDPVRGGTLGPYLVDDDTFFENAMGRGFEDALTVFANQAEAMGQFLQFTITQNFVPPSRSGQATLPFTLPVVWADVSLEQDPLMPGYVRLRYSEDGRSVEGSLAFGVVAEIAGIQEMSERDRAEAIKSHGPRMPESLRREFLALDDREFLARVLESEEMKVHPMIRLGVMARQLGDLDYGRLDLALGLDTTAVAGRGAVRENGESTLTQAGRPRLVAAEDRGPQPVREGAEPEGRALEGRQVLSPGFYVVLALGVFGGMAGTLGWLRFSRKSR